VVFINTDGMSFIGPGSEWFWTALSGIVLAVTFLAIYRQLRVQSNASATEQLDRFEREWASERILRAKLAVLEALHAGIDPVRLPYAAVVEIATFWERVGTLAQRGHLDAELLWYVHGPGAVMWWRIFKPLVLHEREASGNPTLSSSLERLAGIMEDLNRRHGMADRVYDLDLNADVALVRSQIRAEEALRAVPVLRPGAARSD